MSGLDTILGSSGMDVAGLGAKFGLTPEQTTAAMGSLLPAILGGFQKKPDAGEMAGVDQGTSPAGLPEASAGNDILGQIFGSKDVSRQVADHASTQSGVSSTVLKAMLPIVVAMVARHAASGGGGGLGGMLGSILGGAGSGGLGGLGGLLGSSPGGNPLDDILSRFR